MRKIFKVALIALAISLLGVGFVVKAETTVNASIIAELQAMIQSLMQQIAALQAEQGTTTSSSTSDSSEWCHTFNDYLKLGDTNNSTTGDIASLVTALESENILLNEGTRFTFNEDLQSGVKEFQEKYGISQTGTVGPVTRAKLNALYGCSSSSATSTTDTTTVSATTPSISSISPTSGGSGTVVTLTGSNFTSDTKIKFLQDGDTYTTKSDVYVSSTKLKMTISSTDVGNLDEGTYQLVAVNSIGQSNSVDFTLSSSDDSDTTSCSGYLDNYVVINSAVTGNGTLSFDLTNTKSTTQTISVSIGSGTVSQSNITVSAGTCSLAKSITYSSSSDTTITFKNSGTTIASFPVLATETTENNNSSITVQRLFIGQYNNTKYSFTLNDPDGLGDTTVKTATGKTVMTGSPRNGTNPCAKSINSGTMTFSDSDFPLTATVVDCKTSNVYTVTAEIPSL